MTSHQRRSPLAPPRRSDPRKVDAEYLKKSGGSSLSTTLELGMLLEGVHLFHAGGFICTEHDSQDIERAIYAFDRVIGRMKDEGHFEGL